jgi:hypothetical protein
MLAMRRIFMACKCGETDQSSFYRNKSRPNGLSFYCKGCTAIQRRDEYRRKYPSGKNGGNLAKAKSMIGNQNAKKGDAMREDTDGERKPATPWTKDELHLLTTMREAGIDWESISIAVGKSPDSCRSKACNLGIRKFKGMPQDRHTGIVNDGPELEYRTSGRPMANKPERIRCGQRNCRKWFMSWDRTKNQRCPVCRSRGENSTFFG